MDVRLQRAIVLLREGKPNAVENAISLLQHAVFSFSMKMCGHREDAEDTSQDVLTRALPHLSKFDSAQALASWLYRVARNRCVSSRRQSKFAPTAAQKLSLDELMPSGRELQELVSSDETTAEAKVLVAESAENVRRVLLKVPPEYRIVLVLHDMEGLDAPEVGRILDIKPGTVRVRLHRARLFLRRELNRRPASAASKPAPTAGAGKCRSMFAALSDYLDGIVDDATCEQMQVHIKDCAPCEAFVQSLQRTVEQCKAYQPECSEQRLAATRHDLMRQYLQAVSTLKSRKTKASLIGRHRR
jgi:RNA polymerase sigma-70 factor, ECF subfamily